jgi:hypothetical protein
VNHKIAFVWRKNSPNVGDRESGWPLYFDFPDHDQLDLDDIEHKGLSLEPYTHVVIGGGLYPESKWYPHVNGWIESTSAKILAIGVGRNYHSIRAVGKNERIIWRHADADAENCCCPCPSCMAKIFDSPPAPTCSAVAYENRDIAALACHGLPTMENRGCTMREAIAFMGDGEKVLTSSYHGAYWSALLGRDIQIISNRGKMDNPVWAHMGFSLDFARKLAQRGYHAICRFLED